MNPVVLPGADQPYPTLGLTMHVQRGLLPGLLDPISTNQSVSHAAMMASQPNSAESGTSSSGSRLFRDVRRWTYIISSKQIRLMLACATAILWNSNSLYAQPEPTSDTVMGSDRSGKFQEALAVYSRENFAEAHRLWVELAKDSAGGAQLHNAALYEPGSGGLEDLGKALNWYQQGLAPGRSADNTAIKDKVTGATRHLQDVKRQHQLADAESARPRAENDATQKANAGEATRQRQIAEEAEDESLRNEARQHSADLLAAEAVKQLAQFEEAVADYNRKDYAGARRLWEPLAERADPTITDTSGILIWPKAASRLGVLYEFGAGVAKDNEKALELYKKASAAGDAPYADKQLERLRETIAEGKKVESLVTEISNMLSEKKRLDDDAMLVFAKIKGRLQLGIKLDGSLSFAEYGIGEYGYVELDICIGPFVENGGSFEEMTSYREKTIKTIVKSKHLSFGIQLHGHGCTLDSDDWDFYTLTKSGLNHHSFTELSWLKEHMNTSLRLVETLPYSDFEKFRADQAAAQQKLRDDEAAAEAKRTAEKVAAEQKRVADLAERDIRRITQRKANFDQINRGDQSGWISSESRLFFLATGSAEKEICYVGKEMPETSDKRLAVVMETNATDAAVSAEPLFSEGGPPDRVENIDVLFGGIQHGACGLAMGSPSELKVLADGLKQLGVLPDGLKQLGDQNVEALSVSYDSNDIDRLVAAWKKRLAEKERLASIDAEKQQQATAAEAKRQQEATAAEAKRQQKAAAAYALKRQQEFDEFPFVAMISCLGPGKQQIILIVCFAGSHDFNTELEVQNGREYNMYTSLEIPRIARMTPDGMPILLRRSFEITTQNAGDYILNLKILNRQTNEIVFEKSASQYGGIRVQN